MTARFADGTEGEADIIVGADGLNSAVRRILHGDERPRYTGWSSLRGLTRGAVLPGGADAVTFLDETTVVLCGVAQDDLFYWSSNVVTDEGTWPRDPVAAQAELLRCVEGWAYLPEVIERADPGTLVARQLRDRPPLRSWSSGRATLLGDAAHPMTNFWGQGAASAAEDGVVLARCLEASDIPAALRAYDAARVPRTTRMVLASASMDRHYEGVHPEDFTRWLYGYDAAIAPLEPEYAR